jgi:hypothetical protein
MTAINGLALGIVAIMALVLAAGAVLVRYGEPLKRLDLERLHLYLVAAFSALFAVMSVGGVAMFGTMLLTGTGQVEKHFVESQLANVISIVVVTGPAWLLLALRAERLSRQRRAASMQRVYLYSVALMGAVGAVICSGMLVAQAVRMAMGLVDLGSPRSVLELQASTVEWSLQALIYAGVWWIYLRSAHRWSV